MNLIQLKSPVKVNLDLTSKCNLHCNFCCTYPTHTSRFHTLYHFKKIIDKLSKAGVCSITLFGGEPFLYPHIIEVAEYIHRKNIDVGFVSNGVLISEEIAKKISRYVNGGSISIHGFAKTHDMLVGMKGAWQRAIDAVHHLKKYNVNVDICFTLVKQNMSELVSFSDFIISKFDLEYFAINRFVPHGIKGSQNKILFEPSVYDFNSHIKKLYLFLRKNYPNTVLKVVGCLPLCKIDKLIRPICVSCEAGVSFCAVDEEGNLKLCSATPHILGNILEEDVEKIWQNSLREFRSLKWVDKKCKTCILFERCFCGCKTSDINKAYGMDILFDE
jgi:radical SAM protein with 4Fe4S-binding SPASM domain